MSGIHYVGWDIAELYSCTQSNPQLYNDMCLLSVSWSCHYHLAQHDTYEGAVSVPLFNCYNVLVIHTTNYIITGTIILPWSWRVAVNPIRYPKSSSLLWLSHKNVSEFNKPVDIPLNHLSVMWDQHVNNICAIQKSFIYSGQMIIRPIS